MEITKAGTKKISPDDLIIAQAYRLPRSSHPKVVDELPS